MGRSTSRNLFLRLVVYAALVAAAFELLVLSVDARGAAALVRDDGPLELVQLLLALGTGVLFAMLSRERPRSAQLMTFFAALSFVACARELDNYTLELGSRDAYKLLAVPPLLWAVAVALRARGRLLEQFEAFSRTSAFSLLLAGFLIVVVYSQIVGQKVLWLAVLDADVYRPVKDLVEESSELLGYILMLFGAAEATVVDPRD